MKIKKHKNGTYYAHITGSTPINLRTKNQDEAVRLAREAKLEEMEFANKAGILSAEVYQRLRCGGRKTSPTDAIDAWSEWLGLSGKQTNTVASYTGQVRKFMRGYTSMMDVDEAAVDHYVNTEEDLKRSTRTLRLSALQSFLAFCHNRGFIPGNPSELVAVRMSELSFAQKETAKRTVFTDDELLRVLQHLQDRWRDTDYGAFWAVAIQLGSVYGLRLSDVAQLEWDQIAGRTFVVWTDKRDRRLELPWERGLDYALSDWLRRLDPDIVFPVQYDMVRDPRRRALLSQEFTQLLKAVGIEGKSFHCLRHTFATRRKDLGDTVDQIREKMGHASSTTTKGYIHN